MAVVGGGGGIFCGVPHNILGNIIGELEFIYGETGGHYLVSLALTNPCKNSINYGN